MTLRGERVALRPLEERDVPRLAEIGTEPEVARWWPGLDEAELRRKVAGGHACAIEHDGRVIGLAQWYEEDDPEYRHAGIDLFLTSELHNRGLGTDAVGTLARWLVRDRDHHRLVVDPAAANEAAVRCYEKAGFRRVGVLRRYWRGPNGWEDGLLLDLLADELE